MTRVDEVQVACQEEPNGALTIDFDASYALKITPESEKAILNQSDEEGEYTVDVSALADDKSSLAESDGHYHLVNTTDSLQLSMVDGKFIRRNWGQPVDGVAVSLTLDRDVYDVGGVVPLHIAVENVDSRKKIAVKDVRLHWAKGNTDVSVELQTPGGQRVISFAWLEIDHCHYLMPGLLYPIEVPLSGEAYPPGIYQAVAVWKPSRNRSCGHPSPADFFTVRSRPVVFRIIEPRHPGVLGEPGNTVKK